MESLSDANTPSQDDGKEITTTKAAARFSSETIYLKRRANPKAKPAALETNLPGHAIEDELRPEFESYLVDIPQDSVAEFEKQKGDGGVKEQRDWFELAKQHKDKGNGIFRVSDKFKEAEKEYHRALHCLRRSPRSPEAEALRVVLYGNLSACDLGKQDYASARRHATKALKHDPNNVKALVRRAQARRYAAFDLDGAEADLLLALKIVPEDAAVKKILDQLRQDRARSAKNEASLAKKMFGN